MTAHLWRLNPTRCNTGTTQVFSRQVELEVHEVLQHYVTFMRRLCIGAAEQNLLGGPGGRRRKGFAGVDGARGLKSAWGCGSRRLGLCLGRCGPGGGGGVGLEYDAARGDGRKRTWDC